MSSQHRTVGFSGERPIRIGSAKEALRIMYRNRIFQYLGIVAVLIWSVFLLIYMPIKVVLLRRYKLWKVGRFWIFVILFFGVGFLFGAVGYITGFLSETLENITANTNLLFLATAVSLIMAVFLPFTILITLFDIVVFRLIRKESDNRDQK